MKARGRKSKKAKKAPRRGPARSRPNLAARAQPDETVASLKRALAESLEQQTAMSEVLKVISSSPGELEPVFNSMLANAVRICGAKFGNFFLFERKTFRIVAQQNAPRAYAE